MTVELSAPVLNIQRMSTEDGPGLRTTVFLKGCSLGCTWCHNPEAIDAKPQLVWYRSRCIGSHECVGACPEDALARRADGVVIDRDRCTACGDCAARCPSGGLEVLGRRWRLDDLVAEVAKDRSYFEASGGGVTVSGGEPGLHAPFVAPFLERCRALGLHVAIDTCGMCSVVSLHALGDHSDLVLYDLKLIDPDQHARFTGQSNGRILANLVRLAARMRAGAPPSELWIRTPLVPGATLTEANIAGIGSFIARHVGDVVTRWELCAFNNLAADQYVRLGLAWPHAGTPLLGVEELRQAERMARASGVDPGIVCATGPTRTGSTEAHA
jgi:pyruvate formate lyase activating enzyme